MPNVMINFCYYPTTVVMVDDDAKFLNKIANNLVKNNIAVKSFTNPTQAIDFINQHPQRLSFIKTLLKPGEASKSHLVVNIDLKEIQGQILRPDRFSEITVVTMEYAMPGIKQLNLGQHIHKDDIQFMLLTQRAGHGLAIQAFNKGLIHQFIMKDHPDLTLHVLNAVTNQQLRHFQRQSNIIFSRYPQLQKLEATLTDPTLVEFFHKQCANNSIVEYYLLDREGSFLLADGSGKLQLLALKNEDSIENYHQKARAAAATESIITKLEKRTHVPFFYTRDESTGSPHSWEACLFPANMLKGERSNYYYSLISKVNIQKLKMDGVLSYFHYLEQNK
jgi:FixJ family two-component response regulator